MSNWKLPASTPEESTEEGGLSQSEERTDEENKQEKATEPAADAEIEDAADEEDEVVDMDEFIEEVERKED